MIFPSESLHLFWGFSMAMLNNQMVYESYGFLWHKSSLSLNTLNIVLRFSRLSSCSLPWIGLRENLNRKP
jgi:hypothetical protein